MIDNDFVSEAKLKLVNGRPATMLVADPVYDLDDLLARVTPENLHGGIDSGPSVGAEAM